jgi:hypothetical protein
LINPKTGAARGQARALGSHHRLHTSAATVELADSRIDLSVPDASSVTLTIEVSFKPKADGGIDLVELAARDRAGQGQRPYAVGSLQVGHGAPTVGPAPPNDECAPSATAC